MTPAFTVVIPFRDRLPLVRRALGSLARQTFRDFETLLVDDGSDEDVEPVAAAFPELDPRVIRTGGTGANAARNAGTDAARAGFVAYLDSDDAYLPERLEIAARQLAAAPADLHSSPVFVRRSGSHVQVRPGRAPAPGEDISDFFFAAGERLPTSGWVVRTAAARAVRWDERLRKVQDPDFAIRLVRAGYRLAVASEPTVVLFDDVQAGRISDSVVLDNLESWLDRSGHLLTPTARAGFEVYALAYEAARVSRLRGLRRLVAVTTRRRPPLRLAAKSLYRMLVPVPVFKATAQLALRARRGTANLELMEYLRVLEQAADPAIGAHFRR
ncbi:MAG: glycosyltransferase family 2 protein [Amaricoccus sp.]